MAPRTVIGAGKLQELVIRCFQQDVDLVIFDGELTPSQARNLAERLDLRDKVDDHEDRIGVLETNGRKTRRH